MKYIEQLGSKKLNQNLSLGLLNVLNFILYQDLNILDLIYLIDNIMEFVHLPQVFYSRILFIKSDEFLMAEKLKEIGKMVNK